MERDEFERRLREIRSLRRQGLISAQEARYQHEDLIAAAAPPPEPSPSFETTEQIQSNNRVLMGAALVVLLAVAAVASAMIYLHLNPDEKPRSAPNAAAAPGITATIAVAGAGTTPTRIPATSIPPTAVVTAVPTAPLGCYSVSSPADKLEVLSVDPPVDGPLPTGPVRVTVRYTLASHDQAILELSEGAGQISSTVSLRVQVLKGTGIVTLEQAVLLADAPTFTVYLYPPPQVYRSRGYSCFSPITAVRFNYKR